MSNRPWVIYGLTDPRTSEIRYVGVNFRSRARFREHISRARKVGKTHVYCWIRSLLKIGLAPNYIPLENGKGTDTWQECESRWIAKLNVNGRLCNHTKGGEGTPGYVPTSELRTLWSKQRKGKKYPPGRKSAMLGKRHSTKARQKIGQAGRGRRPSNHTRQVMSQAAKCRGIPPEQLERMAAASAKTRRSKKFRQQAREARSTKSLLCEQTGQTFLSVREAAAAIGATRGAVQFSLRGRRPCKGFSFRIL